MVWLLERDRDVLRCEIRQASNSGEYEFAVASRRGAAETLRFGSPTELLHGYLRRQKALQSEGWRPRPVETESSVSSNS